MPNASTITINVQATCDESEKTASASFELRVCNMYTLKGLLTEDMTLTPNHVYYVSSNLGVSEGVTLTIEPGTRLEFAKNTGLYGFGKLIIKGVPGKPIIFTAYDKEKPWNGVFSHESKDKHDHSMYGGIYTNNDSTLFTLLPTEQTPNNISTLSWYCYYEQFGNGFTLRAYEDRQIYSQTPSI